MITKCLEIVQIDLPTVIDLVRSLSPEQIDVVQENYVLMQNHKQVNQFNKIESEIITINNLYYDEVPKDSIDFYYNTFDKNKLNKFLLNEKEINKKLKYIINFAFDKVFQEKSNVIIDTNRFIQKSLLDNIDKILQSMHKYNKIEYEGIVVYCE